MTKLLQHIEEMRVRLSEIVREEGALVQALSDALNKLDEELLGGVRTITAEHEQRRADILGELQSIAGGIGMALQPPGLPQAPDRLPSDRGSKRFHERIIGPTDWRHAISNRPSF
jgi:hypothetical protein